VRVFLQNESETHPGMCLYDVVCVCMCAYVYVRVCVYLLLCVHIHVYVCMCVLRVYVCSSVCLRVYTLIGVAGTSQELDSWKEALDRASTVSMVSSPVLIKHKTHMSITKSGGFTVRIVV
jgi:hypothetical protein